MKDILKYIEDGISISGNPKDGYRVFTIPTQRFFIDSLDELTPEKFEDNITKQKEYDAHVNELWRLSDLPKL